MGKRSGVNEGHRMSRPRSYFKTLAWALLALVFLYPMLWMTLSSFKSSNVEIFGHPFSLPHQISLANYRKAVRQGHMGAYFINSLWVTGLSAAAVVCFGAWAGFALSKARFPLRKFWLALFFIGMILPVQSYLIPLTGLLEMLGVHDSLWAQHPAAGRQTGRGDDPDHHLPQHVERIPDGDAVHRGPGDENVAGRNDRFRAGAQHGLPGAARGPLADFRANAARLCHF